MSRKNPLRGQVVPIPMGKMIQESPYPKKGKEPSKKDGDNIVRHKLNTFARWFTMGGWTSPTQKRYTRQVLNIEDLPMELKEWESKMPEVEITFSKKNASDIHVHNDDRIIIIMRYGDWEIKRALVDQGSSTYIIYWDKFKRHHLDPNDLKYFKGSLSWFYRE